MWYQRLTGGEDALSPWGGPGVSQLAPALPHPSQ